MPSFITLEEPPRSPLGSRGFALWQMGFRPFYLLASAFAALSISLWALQFAGWLERPYLQGSVWHAHEMLFGFTLAVVVGFLLTAGRNWADRPTLAGLPLAALAVLWVAGRVLVLTPFGWAAALVNAAFPLAAAIALAIPFIATRSRRNYFFVGLLLLMCAAVLAFHLSQLGVVDIPSRIGLQVALDTVLFIMAVMAGRVIPLFTNNGVPGANAMRHPVLEKAAFGTVLALLAGDALQWHGVPLALLAAISAAAHFSRWILWKPWKTTRTPLVWMLHAAYLWIPTHLALRALAELSWATPSAATHALTVGAAGGLIIGMMTRTARGHTGLQLHTGRSEVVCFGLILSASLVRVFVPLFVQVWTTPAVLVSAALWSAAFAIYFVRYWPVLTRPRVDGRPG